MRIFTICLIIQSLASSLFANPIPVQASGQPTFRQMEAPWFLTSLTADPPEKKAIDKRWILMS
ncbi:hypothetical protein H0H93_006204 [Arthromyces matolae]|nr:hypothetical protein H0H93_006204 [Arthromyces matolae]